MPQAFVEQLRVHIAEEEVLFKMIKLLGWIGAAFLGLICWVFIEKNNDIKAMQSTLNQHSVQIEKTLTMMQAMLDNDKRYQGQLDEMRKK